MRNDNEETYHPSPNASPPSFTVGESHPTSGPASDAASKPLNQGDQPLRNLIGEFERTAKRGAESPARQRPSSSIGSSSPPPPQSQRVGCWPIPCWLEGPIPINKTNKPRNPALICEPAKAAIRACRRGLSPWPLVFHGVPGSGKTCAALCLLDSVGGLTVYRTLGDACDELIQAMNGELTWGEYKASPKAWWEKWETARLSVLDELAIREKTTDHEYQTVKRAIDMRYGKPLVLISNHSPGTIYDERISSRMQAGTVVGFPSVDLRVSGRQAKSPDGAASAIKPSPDGSSSTDSPTSR